MATLSAEGAPQEGGGLWSLSAAASPFPGVIVSWLGGQVPFSRGE